MVYGNQTSIAVYDEGDVTPADDKSAVFIAEATHDATPRNVLATLALHGQASMLRRDLRRILDHAKGADDPVDVIAAAVALVEWAKVTRLETQGSAHHILLEALAELGDHARRLMV